MTLNNITPQPILIHDVDDLDDNDLKERIIQEISKTMQNSLRGNLTSDILLKIRNHKTAEYNLRAVISR